MLKPPEKASGQTGAKILLEAMSTDKVHLVRFILDALDGKMIDSAADGAATPLTASVLLPDSQARAKFTRLLLQRGASVNRQDARGRTALSYACENGHLDAVKLLVQNNADPEAADGWGNTALMYASAAGHSAVVDFLVRAFKRLGLRIDRQNKVGNSAVEVAKYLGHEACLFALTSKTRKSRDDGASRGFDSDGGEDGRGRKCAHASDVNTTQSRRYFCPEGVNAARTGEDSVAASSSRRKSSFLRSKIPSMGSIDEFDSECDGARPWPGDLYVVPVHTRSYHGPNSNATFKLGDDNRRDFSHFAPLSKPADNLFPQLFSQRPAKIAPSRGASACAGASAPGPASGPLGALLTPIPGSKGGEQETESGKLKDFGVRLFHDTYYQKRSSLPTSVLRPAPPPARAVIPARKTKPAQNDAPPAAATATPVLAALGATTTSFAVIGNKLLRRFTFPELRKTARGRRVDGDGDGSGGARSGGSALTDAGMPKSESFPQVKRHPQVGSKPSIDSISSVRCEFDSLSKPSPS